MFDEELKPDMTLVTLKVEKGIWGKVKRLAAKHDISGSALIRYFIKDGLERYSKVKK